MTGGQQTRPKSPWEQRAEAAEAALVQQAERLKRLEMAWRQEAVDAQALASESARMHFSGGSFERHMAVANLSKRHANELAALLSTEPSERNQWMDNRTRYRLTHELAALLSAREGTRP